MPLIETKNLGRYFGSIRAVDGISFSVGDGEVLGFLGPNGAGKSTTMKMLTCFLTPTFGTAAIGGFDILTQSKDVRRVVGYLPENAPLYGEMSVLEFLLFIAEVRGISKRERLAAADRVIALTSLQGVVNQRIETLSKGFRRRVGLAQALIHDPRILILDEPTDGLDPNQKHEVRELIRKMARDKCIILSTHILEEVDEVCTRAIIIAAGKIVADDTPGGLRRRSPTAGAVKLNLRSGTAPEWRKRFEAVSGVKSVSVNQRDGSSFEFTIVPQAGKEIVFGVLKVVEGSAGIVGDLRVEEGELDDVFRAITLKGLAAEKAVADGA